MGCLPHDPYIALSVINTRLRDGCGGLAGECAAADIDRDELEQKLRSIGYVYDAEINQFIREKN